MNDTWCYFCTEAAATTHIGGKPACADCLSAWMDEEYGDWLAEKDYIRHEQVIASMDAEELMSVPRNYLDPDTGDERDTSIDRVRELRFDR